MKRGQVEGLVEGLKKGEAIGLEKGEAIGLEKGEAIGLKKEKEQSVINGYKKGYSLEVISSFTGLTSEQITKILVHNELTG